AIQQAFVDNDSSISHHHGVGLEHAPWLEQDISAEGMKVVSGLFSVTDPGGNLNPGKILPDAKKSTSGPGTSKKPAAARPVSTPAAKVASRTKSKVTAS
ncbi:MAG: FAD-linked oxidase C-terminal domain-containing protein, partial [Pseudolysinimonas sp.]